MNCATTNPDILCAILRAMNCATTNPALFETPCLSIESPGVIVCLHLSYFFFELCTHFTSKTRHYLVIRCDHEKLLIEGTFRIAPDALQNLGWTSPFGWTRIRRF